MLAVLFKSAATKYKLILNKDLGLQTCRQYYNMITEFNFTEEEGGTISEGWLVFYCDNFPIDLQNGNEIWIEDFIGMFKKGHYYCNEGSISNENVHPREFEIPEAVITSIRYGYENGEIIKILGLQAT